MLSMPCNQFKEILFEKKKGKILENDVIKCRVVTCVQANIIAHWTWTNFALWVRFEKIEIKINNMQICKTLQRNDIVVCLNIVYFQKIVIEIENCFYKTFEIVQLSLAMCKTKKPKVNRWNTWKLHRKSNKNGKTKQETRILFNTFWNVSIHLHPF